MHTAGAESGPTRKWAKIGTQVAYEIGTLARWPGGRRSATERAKPRATVQRTQIVGNALPPETRPRNLTIE